MRSDGSAQSRRRCYHGSFSSGSEPYGTCSQSTWPTIMQSAHTRARAMWCSFLGRAKAEKVTARSDVRNGWGGSSSTTIARPHDFFLSKVRGGRPMHGRQGGGLRAGEITQEYDAVLKAARRLPPAEQLRLAQALMSDSQVVAFWEEAPRQF